MRNNLLFLLLLVAAIFFAVGLSIPGTGRPLHIVFVVAGMICGFVFYLISFRRALTTRSLTKGRRMFWILAIICLPMIGNCFFIIVDQFAGPPQVPAH
jgi:hypothetical protein